MEFTSLTLLAEILDAGSLSHAARRLKMSRANVSYRLNQLEKELGIQLVRRTTRQIEPTEIGLKLAEHGRAIQHEVQGALESVEAMGRSLSGRIRLSVPSGYGQMVMGQWLIDFSRAYPGIVLDVRFENRIVDLLQEEVDIAVRVLSDPPQNLVARELGPVRFIACATQTFAAARGLPQTLDDLQRVPIITANVVGRQLRVAGLREGVRQEATLEPIIISEHFPFLRQAILAGLGVGVVPDYVVADCISTGEVVTCIDEWRLSIFGTAMFMLYMPDRRQTLAASTFIKFILDRAAEERSQHA